MNFVVKFYNLKKKHLKIYIPTIWSGPVYFWDQD